MNHRLVLLWIGLFCLPGPGLLLAETAPVNLESPDGTIRLTIHLDIAVSISVAVDGNECLRPSPLSMELASGEILGRVKTRPEQRARDVNEIIKPVVPEKRRIVRDEFRELELIFVEGYGLRFRVYDDGVAYRFFINERESVTVRRERLQLRFAEDYLTYFPEEASFLTHSERAYPALRLSEIPSDKMCCLPLFIDAGPGLKLAVAEADLADYPGLYLGGDSSDPDALRALFPAYPLEEEQRRDRDLAVVRRADYLAVTSGQRNFPWRVLMIGRRDGDLVESDLIYRLAPPLELEDVSWIKPGKVAWDWWNALNLYGVDFKAGVNTESYKYFIDFAASHGLEYIILDEGWSDTADLFKINPEVDLPELLRYGREKKVGLILWVVWLTLERQLQPALDQFAQWGVAGIKVDFMQRDDQKMVNFYHRIAAEAARRELLVNFHGAYKPTGLRRAYPNVITREGIRGLEWNKWGREISPEHDVTIPFTRMLAGPMDYTPGAMLNAQEKQFQPVFDRPMSQGTRCHQLALYAIYESPLQMLADSPSNYRREPEAMRFLSEVPTVWDNTRVLDGKIGDYILMARESDGDWYVAAITDWTPRELSVDFSFLSDGAYTAEIWADGPNAGRMASDFTLEIQQVNNIDKWTIKLASGGGWVARIRPAGK